MGWGRYGGAGPCSHLIELRNTLARLQLAVWSEHGVEPDGWVNVSCEACGRTYETTLHHRREPLTPMGAARPEGPKCDCGGVRDGDRHESWCAGAAVPEPRGGQE